MSHVLTDLAAVPALVRVQCLSESQRAEDEQEQGSDAGVGQSGERRGVMLRCK